MRSNGLEITLSTGPIAAASASACARPSSSRGGSIRPRSSPDALWAVRPCLTMNSIEIVRLTGGGLFNDAVEMTRMNETVSCAFVREIKRAPCPNKTGNTNKFEKNTHSE